MKTTLDHLAIVAPDLDTGCAFVTRALGVDLQPGGAHPRMGTHNRLLRLGPDIYLEVIAIDPSAQRPDRPRWFGMDDLDFDAPPRLATWVARTDDNLINRLGEASLAGTGWDIAMIGGGTTLVTLSENPAAVQLWRAAPIIRAVVVGGGRPDPPQLHKCSGSGGPECRYPV